MISRLLERNKALATSQPHPRSQEASTSTAPAIEKTRELSLDTMTPLTSSSLERIAVYDQRALDQCTKKNDVDQAVREIEEYLLSQSATAIPVLAAHTNITDASIPPIFFSEELRQRQQRTSIKELAEDGYPNAHFSCGVFHLLGSEGFQVNHELAISLLEKAAEKGHTHAQLLLGSLYTQGPRIEQHFRLTLGRQHMQGIKQNLPKAEKFFKEAITKDPGTAYSGLAYLYSLQHLDLQASEYYQKAINYGVANSQAVTNAKNSLGMMYYKGIGGVRDSHKAAQLWQQAADNNSAFAKLVLGTAYHDGDGVSRDMIKAEKLFNEALVEYPSGANYYLGILYFHRGDLHNPTKAVNCFNKAIAAATKERDISTLQSVHCQLALQQIFGIGIPANKEKGMLMLRELAEQGCEEAKGYLDDEDIQQS